MNSNRNWQQKLQDAATRQTLTLDGRVPDQVITRGAGSEIAQLVQQLREAGARFDARRDSFAQGKGQTCADIAAKVERFGSFASDKQQDFAMKLIGWSLPRGQAVVATATPAALVVPQLFAVMQKHAHFHADPLKLSRKNQDTLVWIVWHGTVVGKIENARVTLFTSRLGADADKVRELLVEFSADPLAAAQKYGRLSGRCACCGRDLTDPESIAFGVGPVCREAFN